MSPARKSQPIEHPKPLVLIVPADEALRKIDERIQKGQPLQNLPINNSQEMEDANAKKWSWHNVTKELLRRLFSTEEIANEFEWADRAGMMRINPSLYHEIEDFRASVKTYLRALETIKEKLEIIPFQGNSGTKVERARPSTQTRDVFVVHGHDEAARETLCRFLEKLELNPIVLHEKPNEGKTIIEKFEKNASVGFAVVLLTPDDSGKANSESDFKPRARQNVVFELGYFIGALGRAKVCCLFKKGVEIPSDYSGVIYTEMDLAQGWKLLLAREISASGIPIDMNKAL